MQNRLGICKGLGDMAHTGEVIRKLTYDGLLKIGIGNPKEYEDIPLYIHMCTPDEGSNMLKAWKSIEGAGCVCHRQQTCLGKAMSCASIQPLLKKIKGICAHFHRSNKVSLTFFCLCFYLDYLLHNCIGVQGFTVLCNHGLLIKQKVTKPPAASETRWAGILPQISWLNEHHEVVQLYEKQPAENCAVLDDGTSFSDHAFSEHDWCMVADLDAVVRPCGPFISTMEATERVTMSLVIPMTLAILHATSRHVPVEVFEYVNGEFTNIHIKEHSELTTEVQEVRKILYDTNNKKFHIDERIGHREDLLICTILDPRFKLMNFPGCTPSMKEEAEFFLTSAFNADWSPTAITKGKKTVGTDSDDEPSPASVEIPTELVPTKKKIPVCSMSMLMYCSIYVCLCFC